MYLILAFGSFFSLMCCFYTPPNSLEFGDWNCLGFSQNDEVCWRNYSGLQIFSQVVQLKNKLERRLWSLSLFHLYQKTKLELKRCLPGRRWKRESKVEGMGIYIISLRKMKNRGSESENKLLPFGRCSHWCAYCCFTISDRCLTVLKERKI